MHKSHIPPTILIAESNADILTLLKFGLTNAGYRTVEAIDGRQAEQLALCRHPDLILTEICLPHIDGLDVTRTIRRRARLQGVPVIAISDQLNHALQTEVRNAGCNEIVTKPFTIDEIVMTVKRFIPLPEMMREANSSFQSAETLTIKATQWRLHSAC